MKSSSSVRAIPGVVLSEIQRESSHWVSGQDSRPGVEFSGHCQAGLTKLSEFFETFLSRFSISNLALIVDRRIVS
jgi:hypothetical protein